MPIKINSYACDFRCGYTATKKKSVENHEINCSSNPMKKGCRTCKHLDIFRNSNGMDGAYEHKWIEMVCDIGQQSEPTKRNPHGLRFNCDDWDRSK